MCAHRDEDGPDEPGKNRILRLKHTFDLVPPMFGGIEAGCDEIGNLEWAMAFNNFVPTAGDGRVKQPERDQCAPNHDRGLNQIGPDNGLDPAKRGVNGRENDDGDRRTEINPESLSLVW